MQKEIVVERLALEAIEALRPLVDKIERRDRDLAKQIRTAASSVALNAGEGAWGRKGHKDERISTALCSAREAKLALQVAVAWGYLGREEIAVAHDKLDHTAASLFRMLHPRC
jgi:four helix bundle protein